MLLQSQYANMLTWKVQKRDDLCCFEFDRCYDGRNVLQAATLGVVAGRAAGRGHSQLETLLVSPTAR